MTEWQVTKEEVFPKRKNPLDNPFYGYRRLGVKLPDGRDARYHGVVVPDCVHVVALEDDETTYLVRQSRPNAMPVGNTEIPRTWELPGGFDDLSDLAASARKELEQEIGKRAATLLKIGVLLPSPGVSSEHDHIYLGSDLEDVSIADEVEATEQDIEILSGKFGGLYHDMARQQTPVSAQTLAAMAIVATLL